MGRVHGDSSLESQVELTDKKFKMSKGTSIKEALTAWESQEDNGKAAEAETIKLCAKLPPIEKMDASLSTLVNCKQLSLSTNAIEKINGLEAVGETLTELWISYNNIEKLKGVHVLKKLKVLFISNNSVKDWAEFSKLSDCACLEEVVFTGNPLEIAHTESGDWIEKASKNVPQLKKLDGTPIIHDENE